MEKADWEKSLGSLEAEGLSVLGNGVLVVVTCASLSNGGHAVDLKLRAETAVAPNLIDSTSSWLVELLKRCAAKTVATENLRLLLDLSDLIDLVPDLCEDLLSSIDQPLKVATDKKVGKDYLLCDYNRDGDSYR